MYAITGLSAILYPGSAGCDPGLCGPEGTFVQKYVFGPPLLVTWIGYALEVRKLSGEKSIARVKWRSAPS